MDDWGFAEEAFRQYAGHAFQLLAAFLRSAAELDSQLQVRLRRQRFEWMPLFTWHPHLVSWPCMPH